MQSDESEINALDERAQGRALLGEAAPRARLVSSSRYRRHSYGPNHPLGIPRVSLTQDLITAYGALEAHEYVAARQATRDELAWFHTADYIAAMQACEAAGKVLSEFRTRHYIGNFENPYFEEFFSTPATATGASIQAAELVLSGMCAFAPAGGMHHARADAARGFCFFNDTVLAVMRLRAQGWRVLYIDIDAHHGDGVEAAFADAPDVVTFSAHMDTEYAYPFSGGALDCVGVHANHVNLPLPKGVTDAEYASVLAPILDRLVAVFEPEAIVLQAGTDAIFMDPLGKFELTTQGFLALVAMILERAPRHADGTPAVVVTGGGGYHPLALARAWTGLWAVLSARCLPEAMPPAGRAVLEAVEWDMDEDEPHFPRLFAARTDAPRAQTVRAEVLARGDALLGRHPRLARRAATR